MPPSGAQRAGEDAEQRRLAGAVAADEADAVAAQDPRREIAGDHRLAGLARERLRDMLELDDETAAGLRRGGAEFCLPQAHTLSALVAHLGKLAQPTLVATAACRDALARPHRLGGDALVEPRLLRRLGGEHALGPFIEGGVALVVLEQPAAVEPEDAA